MSSGSCWKKIDPHTTCFWRSECRKPKHECFVNKCANRWVELNILSTEKSFFQIEASHLRIAPSVSIIENTCHMLNSLVAGFKWSYTFFEILSYEGVFGITQVRKLGLRFSWLRRSGETLYSMPKFLECKRRIWRNDFSSLSSQLSSD